MAIPNLNIFSKEAQTLVKKMLFENFSLEWPMIVKLARKSMREDLKTVSDTNVATVHPYLSSQFNYYLKEPLLESTDEVLNEFWRILFSKEYNRMQMKELEKEIDMSDVQTINFLGVQSLFQPYGWPVCVEKRGIIRIQPWVTGMFGQRFYSRASQAKAIIKPRMINKWKISADDIDKALEIIREKNPLRCECLEIDLTKC